MRTRTFFALSGPAILLMTALLVIPLIATIQWSFQNVPVGEAGVFNGFDNYSELLKSPRFRDAAVFTIGFALIVTTLKVVLGYFVALTLHKARHGRAIFLGILLSTYVVPTVVGALDFSWLFNDIFGGPVNRFLDLFGVQIQWLVNEWPARVLLAMHMLWHEIPFAVLIFYAGLQGIPDEPLEAASLVGTESLMTYVFQIALNDSYRLGIGSAVNLLTIILTVVLLIPFLRSTWRDARGTS